MSDTSPSPEEPAASDPPAQSTASELVPQGRESTTAAEPAPLRTPWWDSSWLLLGVMVAAFLVFAVPFVSRLNNFQIGDIEFTGWVGPVAERVGAGDQLYVDQVLPIPPGAFLLLAAIQKVQGRALLLQELWVAAGAHCLMGLLGYCIVRPLTTRLNALLVAPTTIIVVTQIHKECTYDHTAQLVAWSSVALGAHALTSPKRSRRMVLLGLAGFTATATFFFKQSTGAGVLGGWLLALTYLLALALFSPERRQQLRLRAVDAGVLLGGAAVGIAGVLLALVVADIPAGAYWQAVVGDGPELKGGTRRLVFNLFSYVTRHDAFPASFLFTALLFALTLRLGFAPESLSLRSEHRREHGELSRAQRIGFVTIVALTFGGAALLLLSDVKQIWAPLVFALSRMPQIPAFGLFFLCVFFVAQLRKSERSELHHGHAIIAVSLVALVTSLLHNASFPALRPLYDNNAIIPLALMFLYIALDRARLPRLKWIAFALTMAGLMGPKYQRALTADTAVGNRGHWAGMKVNTRGVEVVRAALRVRQLAGPDETVLVLPEDVQLRRLIGRPRPPVKGAILFVDQYPSRLLDHDMEALRKNPPKVIVVHPRRQELWKMMFGFWSKDSATARLMRFRDQELMPGYRRDSSFRTVFFREQTWLDIYVRVD